MSTNMIWTRGILTVWLYLTLFIHKLTIAVDLDHECKRHCDDRRPTGHYHPFEFKCDAYSTEDDRNKCKEDCEYCPKDVCDEYLDANSWHCRSVKWDGYLNELQSFCEENRPKGFRNSFTLNCDQDLSGSDSETCRKLCSKCPSYTCSASNTLHCTAIRDKDNYDCKPECDKARKFISTAASIYESHVTQFLFKCDKEHAGDQNAIDGCQNKCKFCPDWICDQSVDNNTYHCPAATIDGNSCSSFCSEKRPQGEHNAFLFDCEKSIGSSNWNTECASKCNRECGSYNYVCDAANPKNFFCPQEEPKYKEPQEKPSYKGRCKDKCEANRGGGYNSYTLNCNSGRYKTVEELQECPKDCSKCPPEVCDSANENIFNCKDVPRELKREKKEKEKQKKQLQREVKDAEETRRRTSTQGAMLCFFIIVIVGSYVGCYVYCEERSRKRRLEMVQQENLARAQLMAGHQSLQQQQMQMSSQNSTVSNFASSETVPP